MTTYVENAWYVAGWDMDLEPGQVCAMTIIETPLAIYRTSSGRVLALEDRCVHRLAPLSRGRCEGESLRCMYHGFVYNDKGKVTEIPGQDTIPDKACIKSYPVCVRHSWIWVWMGDPAKADETLIPPAIGFDDPDYILGRGQMDYQAAASLIHDNLCDFSHLAYVHANSFGASKEWAEIQPKVTQLERGVRFSKWVPDQHGISGMEKEVGEDVWSNYEYHVPGILLMTTNTYPAGTAEKCQGLPPGPDLEPTFKSHTSQAVTAMDAQTARYFFSWGPHKKFGNDAMRDGMVQVAQMAFTEDREMIEAQQKVINANPEAGVLLSQQDRGVTLYNRLCEKLAKAEQQQ